MRIGDITGHRPPSRSFGVTDELVSNDVFMGAEIELESAGNLPSGPFKKFNESRLWHVTDDSSLRNNGREFIMCESGTGQPLMGADIVRALDAFQELMDEAEAADRAPTVSTRTSMHIHLDGRDLQVDELKRFILLYYTFEEIFFNWVGEGRRKSQYCRGAADHQDIVYRAARMLSTAKQDAVDLGNGNKYDSMNYLSLQNIGTIEIRMMKATLDTTLIKNWMNLLLRLRAASRDETLEVDHFPELASANGVENLLESVFGEQAELLAPFATPTDILHGVRLAQEVLVLAEALKKAKTPEKFFKGAKEDLHFYNLIEKRVN